VAVTHGDVIKAIVADALALHLDEFQRIVVDTGSATIISYTPGRPFLIRLNDSGAGIASLLTAPKKPPARKRGRQAGESDAVVGGR
jgi:broad specificity phosphatase PhoE